MKIWVLVNEIEAALEFQIEYSFKEKPTVEDLISIGIHRDEAISILSEENSYKYLEEISFYDNSKRVRRKKNEYLIQGCRGEIA